MALGAALPQPNTVKDVPWAEPVNGNTFVLTNWAGRKTESRSSEVQYKTWL